MEPFAFALPLIIAFILCLTMGLIAIRLAPHLGLLDIPGGRRQHDGPVPRVGGLALLTSLLAIAFIGGFRLPFTTLEFCMVSAMAVLGFLDDRIELRARWKAILGLVIAVILARATAAHLLPTLVPYELLGMTFPPVPWLAFTLLTLLFWCVPQAINLIDGCNGLATGFGLVVLGSLWGMGSRHPALTGVLLACLVLNWPKARLFLGDCGSLSVGLVLVIFAQKALGMPHPNHLLWLFAYPIIDVLTVVAIRLIGRRPIYVGDRNHLHYQIIDRWPQLTKVTVPGLLFAAAICGSEVYLHRQWRALPYLGLTILLAISAFFIVVKALERFGRGTVQEGPLGPSKVGEETAAVGACLEPRVVHRKREWQKKVTAVNVLALLFEALKK